MRRPPSPSLPRPLHLFCLRPSPCLPGAGFQHCGSSGTPFVLKPPDTIVPFKTSEPSQCLAWAEMGGASGSWKRGGARVWTWSCGQEAGLQKRIGSGQVREWGPLNGTGPSPGDGVGQLRQTTLRPTCRNLGSDGRIHNDTRNRACRRQPQLSSKGTWRWVRRRVLGSEGNPGQAAFQ